MRPAQAVARTLERLEGAFALLFLFAGEHDLLICARRGSPLAIGYGNGEMSVIVPLGWTVRVDFENKGLAALPHSLVILNPVTPLPIEDGVPAFPRALTVRLVSGLLAGETDSFEFVANKEGRFLFFCGVTGHGVAGMWDYLVVSKEATRPSASLQHRPTNTRTRFRLYSTDPFASAIGDEASAAASPTFANAGSSAFRSRLRSAASASGTRVGTAETEPTARGPAPMP